MKTKRILLFLILLLCSANSYALNRKYDTLVAQYKKDTTLTTEAARDISQRHRTDIDNSDIENSLALAQICLQKGLEKDYYYWYTQWRYRTLVIAAMLESNEPRRRDIGMKLGGVTSSWDETRQLVELDSIDYCLATMDSVMNSIRTMPYIKTFLPEDYKCVPKERQKGIVDTLCDYGVKEKAAMRLNYEMQTVIRNFLGECMDAKEKGEKYKKIMQKYCTDAVVKQRKGKLEKDWLPRKDQIKYFDRKKDIHCQPIEKNDGYLIYAVEMQHWEQGWIDRPAFTTTPFYISVDIKTKKIVGIFQTISTPYHP